MSDYYEIADGDHYKNYGRVTNFASLLSDHSGLEAFHKRSVLLGVTKASKEWRKALLTSDLTNSTTLKNLAQEAHDFGGGSHGANQGTWVHAQIENKLKGYGFDYSNPYNFPEYIIDLALIDLQNQWDITHIEQTILNETYDVAGTADIFAINKKTKRHHVLDFKTSRFNPLKYSALTYTIQAYLYASATHLYSKVTQEKTSPPALNQSKAFVIWLNHDGYHGFLPLDLKKGKRWANVAKKVREARDESQTL